MPAGRYLILKFIIFSAALGLLTSCSRENPLNVPEPYVEPPAPPKTQFTPLEFMERFTEQEQLDLSGAALTDPQVKLFYDKMLAAKDIQLNDQRTQQGMALLVNKSLLSQVRADEILTAD